MSLDYFNWLEKQPERIALVELREKHREAFQDARRNAETSMEQSIASYAAAERIAEVADHYECTSDKEDETMHRMYGIHPELFVERQMDVASQLKQIAFQKAHEAVCCNEAASSRKLAFDAVVDDIGKQYDELKAKWEASKTEEASETEEESK